MLLNVDHAGIKWLAELLMQSQELFEAAEQRWLANWQKGPTRRRWSSLPIQSGDLAPDFRLKDSTGQVRSLSEFWTDRPGLLIFWRHFGCGCGVGRAERLAKEYEQFTKAGVNTVVIGQGEPERAAWYKEKFSIPSPILLDPDEHVYQAYGLLEVSPWLLLGKPMPKHEYFENLIKVHREKGRPVADNPFLLPGEFVVNTQGRVVFSYRYQYCDNYPDPEVLNSSIQEALASIQGSS